MGTDDFKRRRDTSRWGFSRHYESLELFLANPVGEGLHTVLFGDRNIDFLIRNRGSDTTVLVFHGALSPRQRTVPYLVGEGIARASGLNLVSLADPTLEVGELACAWFLGDREIGNLKACFKPIIDHILASLGSSNLILFGGSGGGYAAINFGDMFPDSVVLAMNPRLNLDGYPRSTAAQYLKIAHRAETITPMRRIKREFFTPNLAINRLGTANCDILLYQNRNDERYLNHQVIPFVETLKEDPRLYVKLFEGKPGHSPAPTEDLAALLTQIASELRRTQRNFESMGFAKAKDFTKTQVD